MTSFYQLATSHVTDYLTMVSKGNVRLLKVAKHVACLPLVFIGLQTARSLCNERDCLPFGDAKRSVS